MAKPWPTYAAAVPERVAELERTTGFEPATLTLAKVTEVMPATRCYGYLPCSRPIPRTPLATVGHPSVPVRVVRKWHGGDRRCNAHPGVGRPTGEGVA